VIYPDTSFLMALYAPEAQSLLARSHMDRTAAALIFTPFHRVEFRTGIRVRVFRRTLELNQLREAFQKCDEDLLAEILIHTPLVWSDMLREAERIGEAHLIETGVRTGDLLHIASAVMLGAREFLTFDQRQTALAKRAGLKVKGWKTS
jgi:predicted nucleic acid-binding protein